MSSPNEINEVLAGRPLSLLVIDDSAADALMIGTLLKQSGYPVSVRTVSDGETALDFLLRRGPYSGEPLPDVVILDVNLPRRNGFEILREIRQQADLKDFPVFMLTGSRSREDMEKGRSLDVASFITKPHHLEEFEEIIRKFLNVDVPRILKERQRKRADRPQD